MRAVVTFCGGFGFGMNVKCIVWTGLSAGFAGNTASVVKIYDAVFACVKCRYGANFDARSISTMITAHYRKQSSRIGKFAFFDVFNPRPINSDGNLMLRFACHRASVATDALAVINDESEVHFLLSVN